MHLGDNTVEELNMATPYIFMVFIWWLLLLFHDTYVTALSYSIIIYWAAIIPLCMELQRDRNNGTARNAGNYKVFVAICNCISIRWIFSECHFFLCKESWRVKKCREKLGKSLMLSPSWNSRELIEYSVSSLCLAPSWWVFLSPKIQTIL